MWRDELQSPPATRRSISSPTLNMKAIPGSCICCCGDHALHHRSGRDASVASCHRARRLGADLAPLALPAGGSGSISWSAGPTRACCSASALWRCKLAAPSASGHGCCLAPLANTMPLHFAIGAFVPFFSPFVGDVLHKFGGAAADLAASPSSRSMAGSARGGELAAPQSRSRAARSRRAG